MQTDIGLLTACFQVAGEGRERSWCLVQLLQPMDSMGIQVCNEFDCPLLTMTDLFRCIPSHSISHSVSVMHECSSSCTYTHINTTTTVERESVDSRHLVFQHDFGSNLYALNVYCMHFSDIVAN